MKINKKDLIDWERLANDALDRLCVIYNPDEVADWLFSIGYTTDELITLKFDKEAVERIAKELK
jgi:hypothetical protein